MDCNCEPHYRANGSRESSAELASEHRDIVERSPQKRQREQGPERVASFLRYRNRKTANVLVNSKFFATYMHI